MTGRLKEFLQAVEDERLTLLYAQIRQGGEVTDFWSRFTFGGGNPLSAFAGLSRFESYSTAKSFSGVGVCIALDEGLIRLNEKVADSFPDCAYDVTNPYALDITVEDMLKMSSGLKHPLFFRDSPERASCKNWPRYFYEKGEFIYPPGERFLYSNFNTYMLGCLVERKAGCNLLEYMRYRMFEPLGIGNPDMTTCPGGHTVAANGMAINVDEMGRFGEMMLGKGVYRGKRILSEENARRALSPLIATQKPLFVSENGGLFDYGYQFWVDSENGVSTLLGLFGQYCVIIPSANAVVTILSLEQNEIRMGQLLWEKVILPLKRG